MVRIVALDIETVDPMINEGHGYFHKDFRILDCGASYFDENGVMRSCHFSFDEKERIDKLLSFLRKEKFDKVVFHNQKFDLPRLVRYGFPFREFIISDTMIYSTVLEPFRTSNSLASLCNEYNVSVKKISDKEFIKDILVEVLNTFEIPKVEEEGFFITEEEYRDILASHLLGEKITLEKNLQKFTRKIASLVTSYVKNTYELDLKNIKSSLDKVRLYFPKVYYEYLTTDTEATLNLYYVLEAEVERICKNFDDTFNLQGKTLKDIIKLEEDNIKTDLLMSTTELSLDWERVHKETAEYNNNLQKIMSEYPLFFHEGLSNDISEEKLDNLLWHTKSLLESKYEGSFLRELEIINYTLKNIEKLEDKIKYAEQSFIFQKIDSIQQKNFKEITKHYLGEMVIADKYKDKKGNLSLSDASITQAKKDPNLTKELEIMFEFIEQINKIDTNYTKFLRPFEKAKSLKGGLYTELYSYKTTIAFRGDDEKGTATGRMSSNNFNIQTLPKANKDNYNIRGLFLPRIDSFKDRGYRGRLKRISIDYEGQENRILQFLSDCKEGLAMYRNNQSADPHATTAALVLLVKNNISLDNKRFIERDKNSKESRIVYDGNEVTIIVGEVDRNNAKAVNFGIAYHIGPKKLAENLGISVKEAKELIDLVSKANPEYIDMYKKCIRTFSKYGYVANPYGRIYKPYKFKKLYKLSYFEKFFKAGHTLSMEEKNIIMEERANKLKLDFLPSIWDLPSKEFYLKLTKDVAEYRDLCKLKKYENYVEIYEKAKEGVYIEGDFSEVIYLMYKMGLFYKDDRDVRDIIALHAKFVFKDDSKFNNWDYKKECLTLRGIPFKSEFPYKSAVKKLRGDNLAEWSGREDMFQVNKYFWTWSWHICNFSIDYTFDFLKKIVNAMCQGTGADMLKQAKADMWKAGITDPNNLNFIFDLHFPVHDSLEGTVTEENYEENIKIIKQFLEVEFKGVIMLVDTEEKNTCQIA